MKEANAEGLDVVAKYGSLDSYANINRRARFKLFEKVSESCHSSEDIIEWSNDHTHFMMNRRTGIGSIAEFD